MEETEKPRYPKHLDVGRIVIEETPEEKEELIRRDVIKRDEVKQRHKDTDERYEVERRRRPQRREDVVKVGRMDVTDYQERTVESETMKERETSSERLRRDRKVCL